MLYLDASALVKLVQVEQETAALLGYLASQPAQPPWSSALSRTEVLRAVLPGGEPAAAQARRVLAALHMVELRTEVLERAGTLRTAARLRTLDAIHLACALTVAAQVAALVTYDHRMGEAATAVGLFVVAPS